MTFHELYQELGWYAAAYVVFMTVIIGLVMGSFLNCCAIRICNGESISRGRSHCMDCGHVLGVLDLIPVFSWLSTKGRCRYCGANISVRYPITELVTAIVYVSLVIKFGLTRECLEMLLMFSFVLCAAFSDIEDYLIPDRFILASIILRMVFIVAESLDPSCAEAVALGGGWPVMLHMGFWSLVGGLSVAFPLYILVEIGERIFRKDLMGGGDIKLWFAMGLFFTWQINLFALFLACLLGIAGGAVLNKRGVTDIPWGPYIVGGIWLSALFGGPIINAYMSLL